MAAVSIDFAVCKIVSLLENKASLLGGVHDEFREIKLELISMRSFLEDADRKKAQTEVEKAWVENVRDIAYDVEDIIDEFMYHMNRTQREGISRRFLEIICLPKKLWVRHKFAMKLQQLINVIKVIRERHQRYGLNHCVEGTSSHNDHQWVRNRGESSLFIGDEELVGIEDDKELLLRLLMDGESQRTIISVVGMGGSGKTTLAAQLYKCPAVKQHFACCAWICVSQTYVIEDLLKSMIKEFYHGTEELIPKDLGTLSYKQLVEMLVNYLEPMRYVVVFDDVWNINLWTDIRVSLPNNKHGSRVLFTTRKEDIASFPFGVRSHVHHIQPLGKNEAWVLFCMKAFSSSPDRCCPPELEVLSKGIIEKCQGLPLAIVALGGLMSSKKLESEWGKVYNSLSWELSNNPMLEVVKSILLLSFSDLPYQLKHCFLYCGIFPEDYLIQRKRLIRLWMAEGFVEEVRGVTPEEVAESYLMELSQRSMLQVVRNPSGRPKACKMHDLVRELVLSILEKEKFCILYDGRETIGEVRGRRLSVQTNENGIKICAGLSQVRSFFVFCNGSVYSSSLSSMLSGFRLLRVLDLEYVPIHKLPDELGNLFNLRYLSIKGTLVEELPKSIGRLCNLQTLNLYQTKVKVLPDGVANLQNLRYLIACHYDLQLVDEFNYANGTGAPSNITKLKNLQVLHFVEVNGSIMRQVNNLIQLTCMGITKVREVDEMNLCTAIQKLNSLQHLTVMAANEEEVLQMNALSLTPPHLRRLALIGKLEKVPHWFHSLQSLRSLYLSWSRLTEDPLPYIQALPNLQRLTLVNAYAGKQLCFHAGFPQLKKLIVRNFPQLNEIIIEKGVMPGIQDLWYSRCMELKMLPQGIEYLTNLQRMTLVNVSEELIECIRGEESVDRPKVKHIQRISHYYQTSSGWSRENLS